MMSPIKVLLFCLMISNNVYGSEQNADIVFPNDKVRGERHFNLSTPSLSSDFRVRLMPLNKFTPRGCGDSDYCEESDDYPDIESVKKIVKNFGNPDLIKVIFSQIGIKDPLQSKNKAAVPIPFAESFDVSSRLNPKIVGTISTESDSAQIPETYSSPSQPRQPWDEYDLISETPLCHTEESYVFPKTAKTKKKQWRFVINVPSADENENFVQAVKVEKCLNDGGPCNLITCDGSTTICRQKYEYTRLLALREDGTQYVDEFRFPSGCVCNSKKSRYTFAFGRSDESEALLVETTEDFKTSQALVSAFKEEVIKRKKPKNNKRKKKPKMD